MATRSAHLKLTGRVQGVGYRAWFEREALRLGLFGWVRNRRDGSVEAVVSGDANAVAALIEQSRTGPPAARVQGIEVSEAKEIGESFDVRPTE